MTYDDAALLACLQETRYNISFSILLLLLYPSPHLLSFFSFQFLLLLLLLQHREISSFVTQLVKIIRREIILYIILFLFLCPFFLCTSSGKIWIFLFLFFFCLSSFSVVASFHLLDDKKAVSTRCVLFVCMIFVVVVVFFFIVKLSIFFLASII